MLEELENYVSELQREHIKTHRRGLPELDKISARIFLLQRKQKEFFPVVRISRDDLVEKWNGAETLTDDEMELIARKMGDNESIMEVFWLFIDDLEPLGLDKLTRKER